jgi:hypothetical protein
MGRRSEAGLGRLWSQGLAHLSGCEPEFRDRLRNWALLTDGLGGLRAFDHTLDAEHTEKPAFGSTFRMGVFERSHATDDPAFVAGI